MWLGQVSVRALKIMVTDHGQRSEMIRANLTWFQNREYGFIHVCSNEPKGTAFTPEVILNVSYDINSEMKSRINLKWTDWSKFNFFPFRFANYPPTMLFVSSMIREGSVFFLLLLALKRRPLNKNDIMWIQIDKCIKLCERPDEEGPLSSIDGIYARVAPESGDFDGFHSISTEIQIIAAPTILMFFIYQGWTKSLDLKLY